jgi:N-acetyl-alpha-D-muramate 1-phosphate uridylyltransferase
LSVTEASDNTAPRRAMVLAAGLGLRMRPITLRVPKPLIEIGGRSMLDRAIDSLEAAGVEEVVVNAHYLADAIEHHVTARRSPRLRLSLETARLETGGGIARALPLLGTEAFFAVNGDILWRDGPTPTLACLAAAWDPGRMDALLMLHPVETAIGYDGPGDFALNDDGTLSRRADGYCAPYLFAGIQILHPRLFDGAPEGSFSLNLLYNNAIATGRLHGTVHGGSWCHVGTPADIPLAEEFLHWRRSA